MLDDLKKHFENSTIMCIGDVMVDRFVYGKVDRISPESPVPVLQIQRNFTVLGGAGNVARLSRVDNQRGRKEGHRVDADRWGRSQLYEPVHAAL